jgi:hypothetical protein
MTEITAFTGLSSITEGMDWHDRIQARVANINILCDAVQREILVLGSQLAACKWSGEFLIDDVWTDEDDNRTWAEWLKRRSFKLVAGSSTSTINKDTAATLMAWASCYETIASANSEREIPLPLPDNPTQLVPFMGILRRVDDWEPKDWPISDTASKVSAAKTEPPYAARQPEFVRKWEEVWNSLPPERRIDKKGKPRPPGRNASFEYLRLERKMLTPDPPTPTLNIGEEPQTPESMAQAATAEPPPKVKAPPRISQAEREEQQRRYELEQNTRKYRLLLLSLQQSSEALEDFLKSTLVRYGGHYLEAMRDLDLGSYSVTDDVGLLRSAVSVQQICLRLMTEDYVPPTRVEVDPSAATVDV